MLVTKRYIYKYVCTVYSMNKSKDYISKKQKKEKLIVETLTLLKKGNKNDIENNLYKISLKLKENIANYEKIGTLSTSIRTSAIVKDKLEKLDLDGKSHNDMLNDLILRYNHLKKENSLLKKSLTDANISNVKLISKEKKKKILNILDSYKVTYSYDKLIFNKSKDFDYNLKIENIIYNGNKDHGDLYLILPIVYNINSIKEFNTNQLKIIGEILVYFLCLREIIYEDKVHTPKISKQMSIYPKYWSHYFRKEMNLSVDFSTSINLKIKKYEEKIKQTK